MCKWNQLIISQDCLLTALTPYWTPYSHNKKHLKITCKETYDNKGKDGRVFADSVYTEVYAGQEHSNQDSNEPYSDHSLHRTEPIWN